MNTKIVKEKNIWFFFFSAIMIIAALTLLCVINKPKTKDINNDKQSEIVQYTMNESHILTANKYLLTSGIASELKLSKHSIYTDDIYGALCKSIPSSTKVVMRIANTPLIYIPHNTLIVFPDRAVIFDRATESLVYAWDPAVKKIMTFSFSSFEKDYRANACQVYKIADREYKGDM